MKTPKDVCIDTKRLQRGEILRLQESCTWADGRWTPMSEPTSQFLLFVFLGLFPITEGPHSGELYRLELLSPMGTKWNKILKLHDIGFFFSKLETSYYDSF